MEVEHVLELVLNHSPARVAIVGSGGIGKTSIALTAIHHPEVEKDFLNQRFFLSCEALVTADSLAGDLLKLFGLSSGSRSPTDVIVFFVQAMTTKCVLCLDNFETPWDCDKDNVESLLIKMAVPNLTLMITSRDSDRPRGIKWTAPLLPPIKPLTVAAAVEIWDAISHGHDDFSLLLISVVDCIPLAVTLLAQLAETESAQALWRSWETESTKLIKTDGSAHRLNNLELSIELSLRGPRLHGCSGALDFFVVLCILPQGLRESRISELEAAFGSRFQGTRSAIRVLKQCSLAYAVDGFHRVLSPVRQYTLSHPELESTLATTLLTQMAEIYFGLIPTQRRSTMSNVVRENIHLEISNITAVLCACLARHVDVAHVVQKVLDFSNVSRYLGVYDTKLLLKAASVAHDHSLKGLEGQCYHIHGQIDHRFDRLSNAEKMLKAALDMHIDIDDKLGQANDLRCLGNLYVRLNRVVEAEQALKSALELHTEVKAKLGQANDLGNLGNLYASLDRLVEAEQVLKCALELHAQVNDKLGQANDLQNFGEVYTRLNHLEEAKEATNLALQLHTEVNDQLGQANDLRNLAEIYAKLNQIGQAEGALKLALELHTEVNDKFGQANDLHNLGELYARLNRLEEAEGVSKLALELHPDLNSKSDHAADSRALYPKINVTEEILHSPLDLQIELKHALGQANDLQSLGEL